MSVNSTKNKPASNADVARAAMFGGPPKTRGETLARIAALTAFGVSVCTMLALSFVNPHDMLVTSQPPPFVPTARVTGPASARPLNDESQWIGTDDYPPAAIRAGQQGTVSLRWTIGVDGRVHDCGPIASSGYPILDRAGCKALIRRARYLPARDAGGVAIATTKTRRIVWKLPGI